MKATNERIVDEILDQLDNLRSFVRLFYQDRQFTVYKSIAVSLRLLLVGSSGDKGLVSYAIPNCLFPRLLSIPDVIAPPDHFCAPGQIVITNGGTLTLSAGCKTSLINIEGGAIDKTSLGEIFDHKAVGLLIEDWLAQPFLRHDLTLDRFLRSIANKDGGAHLESTHASIAAFERWAYFHWHITAGIARELITPVARAIQNFYPSHVRAIR